ncbi:dihydrolipoamide dehydrogenase [Fictibacillus macauensis ZFHKF-1]|uniref:Dihydrolipoyl dehydrogenase n=1 Tax=Fictibacillus macauensis ZFHKF-1 TaxID=1196324 RepID=I8UG44_9BACL|nr:FAD-dependent oxidoreductase [Fictibacillus macauensis]EIT85803.1 dihydrolipoamide dehydrogenase [Fictibacillus macauensis ZFHKF-1]
MVVGEFVQKRQLMIIGGGPGGYHAAIRAAQLGLEVTLVEKEAMGGVCLNEGCIPTKAMTQAASNLSSLAHYKAMGINVGDATFSLDTFRSFQEQQISNLRSGVEALCKANRIEILRGTASFMQENRIGVETGHQFEIYEYEQAIIAVGATMKMPKELSYIEGKIMTLAQWWKLSELPEHLLVIGSDYMALEAAFTYCQLGSQVTLMTDDETFGLDRAVVKELQRVMKKEKIKLLKNSTLIEVSLHGETVIATVLAQEERVTIEASHLLVAGSYEANSKEIGCDFLKIAVDEAGMIEVDEGCATSVQNIYAVGDCTIGPKLASKAIKQGKVAAECIGGLKAAFNLASIPMVIHTNPPIAYSGLREDEAKAAGYTVKSGQFAMGGNGFTALAGQKDGVVKLVMDEQSDLLLGVHMLGRGATELIQAGVMLLEMAAREEDVAYPLYAHPSLSEAWMEAVEAATGKAIHIPPSKKKETLSK